MLKIATTLFLAIGLITFSSCDKENKKDETTLQKVQHRWTFEKEIVRSVSAGGQVLDTLKGLPGDFYDFQTSNDLIRKRIGYQETLQYAVSGTDKIIFSSQFSVPDTLTITLLTDKKFQLVSSLKSAGTLNEGTVYLVR